MPPSPEPRKPRHPGERRQDDLEIDRERRCRERRRRHKPPKYISDERREWIRQDREDELREMGFATPCRLEFALRPSSRNPMPEMIRQTVPAETCAELVNDQSGEIVREVTEKTLPFWGLSR